MIILYYLILIKKLNKLWRGWGEGKLHARGSIYQ